jgi:GT2 family glycosyltransferase
MDSERTLSVIQITTKGSEKRKRLLLDEVIPRWCKEDVNYYLVSAKDMDLARKVTNMGGRFIEYFGWEKDKSNKWRCAIPHITTPWCGFFDDDIYPTDDWLQNTTDFLSHQPPGQYGFRLTSPDGDRHAAGEDWMAMAPAWPFADTFGQAIPMRSQPLEYDIDTGTYTDCEYTYVANSIAHREVWRSIPPFGLFNRAPDVFWSFAIRDAGFKIGFNTKAVAVHAGDKTDNR